MGLQVWLSALLCRTEGEEQGKRRNWCKGRDEYTAHGCWCLPWHETRDVFTAAQRCTVHIYRRNGANAAAAGTVCALCWSDQILHSCFETTLSGLLAYLFTMAVKAGSQQLSEGSTDQHCAPALLSVPWHSSVKYSPSPRQPDRNLVLACLEQEVGVETSQSPPQCEWFWNSRKEFSGWHTGGCTHGALQYQAITKLQHALNVVVLSAEVC